MTILIHSSADRIQEREWERRAQAKPIECRKIVEATGHGDRGVVII